MKLVLKKGRNEKGSKLEPTAVFPVHLDILLTEGVRLGKLMRVVRTVSVGVLSLSFQYIHILETVQKSFIPIKLSLLP